MEKVITIEDIAREAGVGKGTVDRVLHNRGRVAAETRDRVLKCIEELGYKPNTAARMLAKTRIYKIAVIYHDEQKEFWGQIRKGVEKAQEEFAPMGVKVDYLLLPYIDVQKQLNAIQSAIDHKYDGLAIVPYQSPRIVELLNSAIKNGLQVVTFNSKEKKINCSYIGQDGYKSGQTAGKLLSMIAEKESNYAVISATNRIMTHVDERNEGFQDSINRYRKDMKLEGVYTFPEDNEFVYTKVKSLVQEKDIDAIYVTTAMTGTVAKAVNDADISKKIFLMGHDLTETNVKYLKKGIIDILIGQEPERQSYEAVSRICRKLLTDEKIEDDIYTGIHVYVQENIDNNEELNNG